MLSFIICLGILVLIHEWGHFIFARINGVFVEEFSIGFGFKLFAKKWGSTLYKICALPLGGYVKMKGENPDEQEEGKPQEPDSFAAKSIPRRLSIVLAGPFMNVVLCFLLIPAALMIGIHEPSMADGPAIVGQVVPGSPADAAGVLKDDAIVAVQSIPVTGWNGFVETVQKQGWLPLLLKITRDGKPITIIMISNYDSGMHRHLIGIQRGEIPTQLKRYPFGDAIKEGVDRALGLGQMTFAILGRLFKGELSYKALSGPLGIAKASAEVSKKGLGDILMFMAFLSMQLGILNLLPIPVLDGGHVFFMTIEAIIRRPVSVKIRGYAQIVGIVLLLSLMLAVTINDANTLFGLKAWITKLFSH